MQVTDVTFGSQYTRDFERPLAAAAVRKLDPQLELVFNRQFGLFQVVRHTLIATHYFVAGLGHLLHLTRHPFLECDVLEKHRLEKEDNPYLLVADMKAHDTRERPELVDDSAEMEALLAHRTQLEEKVRENWEHGFRFNRRQMLRIWEPFYNYTGFVR